MKPNLLLIMCIAMVVAFLHGCATASDNAWPTPDWEEVEEAK